MTFREIYRNVIRICQIFLVQVRHCSTCVSKIFCFVIVFISMISITCFCQFWTETYFFNGNINGNFLLLFWFAKIDALSILQWSILLHKCFSWFNGSNVTFKGQLNKDQFVKRTHSNEYGFRNVQILKIELALTNDSLKKWPTNFAMNMDSEKRKLDF